MAKGYTRTKVGNIGTCLGMSGPTGTDMVTGTYSIMADSLFILCITGQVSASKLDREDFQGVDIASIAAPVTKYVKTVLEPTQILGIFRKAFYLMREDCSGPALIGLPGDVWMAEIDFDVDAHEPIGMHKPVAFGARVVRLIDLIASVERLILLAGDGIIQSDGSGALVNLAETPGIPVIFILTGWGVTLDDHVLSRGMAGV